MKQLKNLMFATMWVVTLIFGTIGCSNVGELVDSSDGSFVFTASRTAVSVTTKADAGISQFTTGTKYYLFALDAKASSWSKNYMTSVDPSSGAYVLGTESDSHTINYTGNSKFNGKTLNFYGVTENLPAENTYLFTSLGSGSTAPAINAAYPTNANSNGLRVLPDYMWAKLSNQSYKNAGTITMPFIHTTSKLNLLAVRTAEVSSTLAITKIELYDYASGKLNIETGDFESGSSEIRSTSNAYTVFSGSQIVTTTSTQLKYASGDLVQPTIFPTRGSNVVADMSTHSLGIKVTMNNGKTYTYWTKEPAMSSDNIPITDGNGNVQYKPFQFEPNYVYDLQLTITADNLVVTVLPRKYGWISVVEEQNNNDIVEVGNPVTFGGVVWMDRNLGATSADPLNSALDWEKSRGWFYQFGRSIPYYVKGSMQDPNHINDTFLSTNNVPQVSETTWYILDQSVGKPYPYVYGHYTEGPIGLNAPSSYAYDISNGDFDYISSVSSYSASNLAKMPNASGNFNFVVDYASYGDYPQCPFDWDYNHSTSATYWNTEIQQPCPKGWRLPTKDECLTIFPYDADCGDICFNTGNTNIIGHSTISHDIDKRSSSGYYIDYSSKDGQYVGMKNSGDAYATIYAIKNQGTEKAYRIKWYVKSVSSTFDSRTRQVLVVERFPSTISQSIIASNYGDYVPDYSKYDWDHPSEVLYLPMTGMVYARYLSNSGSGSGVGYIYPGTEALYWTSDAVADGNYAYSMRMRIDNTSDTGQKALFIYGYDHRGWGGYIRCVRDDSVKE